MVHLAVETLLVDLVLMVGVVELRSPIRQFGLQERPNHKQAADDLPHMDPDR